MIKFILVLAVLYGLYYFGSSYLGSFNSYMTTNGKKAKIIKMVDDTRAQTYHDSQNAMGN